MKGAIALVIVLLIGYAGITGMQQFKANTDLAARVDHQLAFVTPTSMDSVKQDIINDAKKLGIDLTADDIRITYEDTDRHTVAQNLVGNKLGMQYVNKLVTIGVDYKQRILAIPFHKNITESHILQVEAPRQRPSAEMNQLLDNAPQ